MVDPQPPEFALQGSILRKKRGKHLIVDSTPNKKCKTASGSEGCYDDAAGWLDLASRAYPALLPDLELHLFALLPGRFRAAILLVSCTSSRSECKQTDKLIPEDSRV